MKIAPSLFLRSLDVNQASPFLQMAWDKILTNNPGSLLLLKDQPDSCIPMIKGAFSEDAAQDYIAKKVIRSVISWSIPNERTIEDVTLLGNVTATPGPLTAVYKLSDKRATKSLFEKFLLPTPEWVVLDREFTHGALLKEAFGKKLEIVLASHISYPMIVKPLWDCMGHGIEIIRDEGELTHNLCANPHRNVLIESFIEGSLGCVEIIGVPGNYFFQPPCFTGQSISGVRSDFDTVRLSDPHLFRKQLTPDIRARLCHLLEHLNFSGACCVDFIVKGADIYFLEINPRISGISCLGSAASGVNVFEALYRIAMSEWDLAAVSREYKNHSAIQVGGLLADKLSPAISAEAGHVTLYRDELITVDGKQSRSIIAGGSREAIERILTLLTLSLVELVDADPLTQQLPSAGVAMA